MIDKCHHHQRGTSKTCSTTWMEDK